MRSIDEFKPGDSIIVYQKGQSPFSGIVISRHGKQGPTATFTVRAILSKVGVEKIYPLNSPLITKIEKIRGGKVKRAKLYYLRGKIGKELKIKEEKSDKKEKAGQKTEAKQKTKNTKTKPRTRAKRKRI